jgi:hypothetical protein
MPTTSIFIFLLKLRRLIIFNIRKEQRMFFIIHGIQFFVSIYEFVQITIPLFAEQHNWLFDNISCFLFLTTQIKIILNILSYFILCSILSVSIFFNIERIMTLFLRQSSLCKKHNFTLSLSFLRNLRILHMFNTGKLNVEFSFS